MINDFGNFLGVALQNGNHLFGVLVEYSCILIVASGQDLAVIGTVYVQSQNAWHTGRMQALQSKESETKRCKYHHAQFTPSACTSHLIDPTYRM